MLEPEFITERISMEDIDLGFEDEMELPRARKVDMILRSTGFGFSSDEAARQAVRDFYTERQTGRHMSEFSPYLFGIVPSHSGDAKKQQEGLDLTMKFALGIFAYGVGEDLFTDNTMTGVWREEIIMPQSFERIEGEVKSV